MSGKALQPGWIDWRDAVDEVEAAVLRQTGPIKLYQPRRLGYVYFIQSETGGPVKIGWARDVPKRLAQLQVSQPYPLVVLGTIRCANKREAEIHKRFAADRLQGEWFETSRELQRFIEKECA